MSLAIVVEEVDRKARIRSDVINFFISSIYRTTADFHAIRRFVRGGMGSQQNVVIRQHFVVERAILLDCGRL